MPRKLSFDYINSQTKIAIKCGKCSHSYDIRFGYYSSGGRCGRCLFSKGESEVERCLLTKDIYFEPQKRIPECRHIIPLPFDFYCELEIYETDHVRFIIPFLIEYNGKQHYQSIPYFGGEKTFKARQRNDNIKLKYCVKEDIYLLVIHYKDYKRIDEVLDSYIEFLVKDTS